MKRALSVLEVLIASTIFVLVLGVAMFTLFGTINDANNRSDRMLSRVNGERTLRPIALEIEESRFADVVASNINAAERDFLNLDSDTNFSGVPSRAFIFSSAREFTGPGILGDFQLVGNFPNFRTAIIYAPFFDANAQRNEIRRYVLNVNPLSWPLQVSFDQTLNAGNVASATMSIFRATDLNNDGVIDPNGGEQINLLTTVDREAGLSIATGVQMFSLFNLGDNAALSGANPNSGVDVGTYRLAMRAGRNSRELVRDLGDLNEITIRPRN